VSVPQLRNGGLVDPKKGWMDAKPSALLAKYAEEKTAKADVIRAQFHVALRWKAKLLGAHLNSLIRCCSGDKAEFMTLFAFFLEHQPENAAFDLDDVVELLRSLPKEMVLPKCREIIKEDLSLTPSQLLQVKDETHMTDKSLKRWTDLFHGLTCPYNEVIKERERMNQEFREVMRPTRTPNGVAIDLSVLVNLLQFVYPQVLQADCPLMGINVDGTDLGGRQTTAGCVRLLNNELIGTVTNSAKDSWCFSLHHGPDTREYLLENIMRTEKPGKQTLLWLLTRHRSLIDRATHLLCRIVGHLP